jgi:hypothetical protein
VCQVLRSSDHLWNSAEPVFNSSFWRKWHREVLFSLHYLFISDRQHNKMCREMSPMCKETRRSSGFPKSWRLTCFKRMKWRISLLRLRCPRPTSQKRAHQRRIRLRSRDERGLGYETALHGLISTNEDEVSKPEREMRSRCQHLGNQAKSERSFMCGTISDAGGSELFDEFWELKTWDERKALVRGLVFTRPPKRR